jgi:hypothetical protein
VLVAEADASQVNYRVLPGGTQSELDGLRTSPGGSLARRGDLVHFFPPGRLSPLRWDQAVNLAFTAP